MAKFAPNNAHDKVCVEQRAAGVQTISDETQIMCAENVRRNAPQLVVVPVSARNWDVCALQISDHQMLSENVVEIFKVWQMSDHQML